MPGTDFIAKLCSIDGNNFCADCGTRAPRWASVNLGVLLCINCSGIHRTLGVHLSQVKSLTLDNLKPEWIKSLMSIGNHVANMYYLYKLPPNVPKYHISAAPSDMEVWIRNKYEKKIYAMDALEEPWVLLSKGFNPRDAVLNGNVNFNQPHPHHVQQQKLHNPEPKPREVDLLHMESFNSNQKMAPSNFNDEFNPFSIDSTMRNNDTYWHNDNHSQMSYKEERRDQLGVPDVPEPEDSDKIRDAKIDAAKNSIARLFQNPAQIGFKSSTYNQTTPNSVSGDTLDFDNSGLKEKLESVNRNL
ncbi:GTPase-activating protein [Theileria orientalis]|uniref:GTPase-activating protein n=1 Tax=Theileria orientalis TaxID=68886 RepID=A0A976M9G8_THEOR|nr:GTPase-activating protein [Theileria orientalis]